jgi:uncharacterized protein YjbK
MTTHRERELKYRLASAGDYERLLALPAEGAESAPERQVNHYFDTADLTLARRRSMLRLRDGGGTFCLTLKCGGEAAPGLFDSQEFEAELSCDDGETAGVRPAFLLTLDLLPVRELRRRFGDLRLERLGSLRNERCRRRAGDLGLEIDRLVFPDGSERYELEVELGDLPAAEAERHLGDLLGRFGVRCEPGRATKLEQFLEWAGRLPPERRKGTAG